MKKKQINKELRHIFYKEKEKSINKKERKKERKY